MARFNGPPPGLYLLQLRERGHIGANCSRVGNAFNPLKKEGNEGVMGTLSVDEYGAGLGVLTRRSVPMLGDNSVLGRSVVLVPRPEGGGASPSPIACAVIARF
ncbi:Superoxide dismutase copper/zinc binding domain [Trinorchestia longiramus]|nr:Superoxide dismutase copper/zinc binding domain [Trinorchestia longiramus]